MRAAWLGRVIIPEAQSTLWNLLPGQLRSFQSCHFDEPPKSLRGPCGLVLVEVALLQPITQNRPKKIYMTLGLETISQNMGNKKENR